MQDGFDNNVFTVSQVNRYIKDLLFQDINLKALFIKGEISNFVDHAKTGHFYFTLKDASSSVRAVMFKSKAERVRFRIKNGMNVIVGGSIQVFERDGVYQFYCETLDPDGIGALYLAFEQLKESLSKEGLFDEAHKKPIPSLPKRIGVVTSKTGAALQDIIQVLARRYPIGTMVLIPALVQGETAPVSIVNAIKRAPQAALDVLIVGRGGGSIEDLWAFNDERVARAIYHCPVPVISAVGHEIDFTIADFVADLRAPTPSAAAELCSYDMASLYQNLTLCAMRLDGAVWAGLKAQYDALKASYDRLKLLSPALKMKEAAGRLQSGSDRMELAVSHLLTQFEQRYLKAAAVLETMSPLKVLTRGYSITQQDGRVLSSAAGLQTGDEIVTRLADGEILSRVVASAQLTVNIDATY